jgi:uncharacterized protein (TIGR02147 family)
VGTVVDVFQYLDYRSLLKDYYLRKKDEGRGFSYRAFARRAGLGSPNHLKRVIDGDRNLSDRSVSQYARALGLDGEAAAYFHVLVDFTQSSSNEQRRDAYERMRAFRGYRKAHRIDATYADYHADWYVPAIRELALRPDFENDPAWIAPRMMPPIEIGEARRALEILFRLGMLVIDEAGRVRQTDAVVSTGEQTRGLHIARYHEVMLERASHAITHIPADERYVASLTFCVGAEAGARVRQRIQRFRQELVAMLAEEKHGDQVVQLGIQLFPLTTSRAAEAGR